MNFKGLSLFANVGIGETYLKDIGYPIVLANELLKDRCALYKHLNPQHEIIQGDITNSEVFNEIILKSKELGVNFILATPPCQSFSILGKQESEDSRNLLIMYVIKAIKELNPDFVLIENVPQMYQALININGTGELTTIQSYLKQSSDKLDYKIKFDLFNTADYGTPQNRTRAITRIYKKTYYWDNPIKQKLITVKQAIGDLPSLKNGQTSKIKFHNAKLHNKKEILCMKHTAPGKKSRDNLIHFPKSKGFNSTYARMSWDKPAPTITMNNGSIGGQENVHPGNKLADGTYSDARVLTLLELFRLTGLPDDWGIPDGISENFIRKVIGEAIPPILTREIFNCLDLL